MGVPRSLLSDDVEEPVGLSNETKYSPWSLSLACWTCIVFNVTDPAKSINTRLAKTGTSLGKTINPFNLSMNSARGLACLVLRVLYFA